MWYTVVVRGDLVQRLIFHVDVNSAFLSWEAARRVAAGGDDLRLIPSAIGGDRDKRTGVILAKSIPAKKFGVTTGEPVSMAPRSRTRSSPSLISPPASTSRPARRKTHSKGDRTMNVMKERMHTGELYLPGDNEIMQWQTKYLDRLYAFNMTRPTELAKRNAMLKEMFAEIGENCYIEPPLHANFGGAHIHFGKNVYANFNLTCVDDTHIYVGDYTMFGPNVTIATAGHPILPELREKGYQYNAPVHIGKNCWIGAGAIILPGITIGDNVVVGAGSVVTKDLPPNVVAVGNPCKVLREVNEHDKAYYFKNRKINCD